MDQLYFNTDFLKNSIHDGKEEKEEKADVQKFFNFSIHKYKNMHYWSDICETVHNERLMWGTSTASWQPLSQNTRASPWPPPPIVCSVCGMLRAWGWPSSAPPY